MADISTRIETDFLGTLKIPKDALYGIHSLRARENFPDKSVFHKDWYEAMGFVKKACFITAKSFFQKASERFDLDGTHLKVISDDVLNVLISAADQVSRGELYDHFIVPAISGGAGTSINLNINEIIANRALQLSGLMPGEYSTIDPIEHANIFQSTNDVIPTSLKLCVIQLLTKLEDNINGLRHQVEQLEKKHRFDLRKGYTQMQEAVPSSFGRLFSTYNEALSRDWWRISKCFERIKVVNLGGSAIGSGITVPRYYIMEVVKNLQELTNLPVTRGENLYDSTNNLDSIVEVHGILKALAVNFEKMVGDIRLLSSDVSGRPTLSIPKKQLGSSIMPGKVNPVIPEFVISAVHKIYANDSIVTSLSGQGCLELNAYLPTIGHAIIESIHLLNATAETIAVNLVEGLEIHAEQATTNLYHSPSICTALVPFLGYNKAAQMAELMKKEGKSIFQVNQEKAFLKVDKLNELLKPENLLKEGFSINEILE